MARPRLRWTLTPGQTTAVGLLVVALLVDAALTLQNIREVANSVQWVSHTHEVLIAHDGSGAIEEAARSRPDVILLDLGLPGMSGYDVARRLRVMRELDGVRLVALTGYGTESDRQKSRDAGFDVHLTKPVDPQALDAVLARAG